MTFREAGHAYGESIRIRVTAGFIIFTDKRHQIRRMAKNIRIAVVILRSPGRISPKCKNGPHSSPGVLVQDIPYLLPAMPYASKVGHRRNTGFMLDAQHHFAGKLAGGAPCTIRHADETGAVRLQFTDSLVQGRCCLLVFGREKFKGQAGTGARLQSFSQVHFSLLGLAKYGSASRLHGNHHRFGSFHGDGGWREKPYRTCLLPSCFPASSQAEQ